jgi:hypothetical protein
MLEKEVEIHILCPIDQRRMNFFPSNPLGSSQPCRMTRSSRVPRTPTEGNSPRKVMVEPDTLRFRGVAHAPLITDADLSSRRMPSLFHEEGWPPSGDCGRIVEKPRQFEAASDSVQGLRYPARSLRDLSGSILWGLIWNPTPPPIQTERLFGWVFIREA